MYGPVNVKFIVNCYLLAETRSKVYKCYWRQRDFVHVNTVTVSTGFQICNSLTSSICIDIWTEINRPIPALRIAASLGNMDCRHKAFSTICFYVSVRFRLSTSRDKHLSGRYNYLHTMALCTAEWCTVFPGHFAFWHTALFAH